MSCTNACECCERLRRHRASVVNWQTAARKRRAECGMCTQCGAQRPLEGKLCDACKARSKAYVAKWRAKKRALEGAGGLRPR